MTLRLTSLVLVALLVACSAGAQADPELRHFPMDDLSGLRTQSGVVFDETTSSDGNGSVKIVADEPVTVRLYEVEGVDIEQARLIYRAMVRTEDVDGQVILEMWCRFPGKGEFFSRAFDQPLSGSVDWTALEAPFFLEAGQNPDLVKLNIIINGTGTVWVDDVHLLRAGL
ncbi:MAG: hypothetical protein HKM89_14430 [Gemmatimonadales bacterium]|nr:hypothetical protein [Gemmatimonadales bacterium]